MPRPLHPSPIAALERAGFAALSLLALLACSEEDEVASDEPELVAVTFNTGTTLGLPHADPPEDGYGKAEAEISDQYYGDGLAWKAAIADAREFFATLSPDVVAFQEIFFSGDCASIPEAMRTGFVCEDWQSGAPSVPELVLGPDYQVACHTGKPDKCLAVRRSFGSFRGCADSMCLDGLDGAEVAGCGGGSRIGRGVIDLANGGTLTVVNVHGTSGIAQEDQDCRVQQFAQVFVDLDGAPAASGEANLILGDLNTDPGRIADFDESAALWNEHVGPDKRFHFVSEVGEEATPSYAELFNIDHVVSDAYRGSCWTAGLSSGHPAVSDMVYFDHKPVVCGLRRP